MAGFETSRALTNFKNKYAEKHGYSGVLKQIDLTITQLSANPAHLSLSEVQEIKNKMNFWKKKLHI